MGVRVKSEPSASSPLAADSNPVFNDSTTTQRETTVDGYTFHWGPNETRNFLDEGVGAAHAAFKGGATLVQEDATPFGKSRF